MIKRRAFLTGLGVLIAAPAIVHAGNLMPIKVMNPVGNNLLPIQEITREAVRLFMQTNHFLRGIDRQYENEFGREGSKIGSQLRIRLPNSYTLHAGSAPELMKIEKSIVGVAATAMVAEKILSGSVTRRFGFV